MSIAVAPPPAPKITLLSQVVCPHCWHNFSAEDAVWIAAHPDLRGDAKLGDTAMRRFLPTRFTPTGEAIDPHGSRSTDTACPRCHLSVPRVMLECPCVFFSILGAPASGKSYLLTSMVWQARQVLPETFDLRFTDADAAGNGRLNEYEEQQFLAEDPDRLVWLAKTEEQGDLYDRVRLESRDINLPKPFLFSFGPGVGHANAEKASRLSRVMCLYDNAGESFLPGADESTGPVTGHLGRSEVLFFCFDPTQDPRFRRACEGLSDDPQMAGNRGSGRGGAVRQDSILTEAVSRARRGASMRDDQKLPALLCVLVTKWDAWEKLVPEISTRPPYVTPPGAETMIDDDRIEQTSTVVRKLLASTCRELVSAAEASATEVVYIPVSATGIKPQRDDTTGQLGIRPRDLAPRWAEVPMAYALSRRTRGLVGSARRV